MGLLISGANSNVSVFLPSKVVSGKTKTKKKKDVISNTFLLMNLNSNKRCQILLFSLLLISLLHWSMRILLLSSGGELDSVSLFAMSPDSSAGPL